MSVIFYYDVVCPFAYMASHLVEAAVARCGGRVHWTPVLLGGLYKETQAPQGKEGSATDVMTGAKLNLVNEDLRRQKYRYGIKGDMVPHHHPQRTLHAMRVLAGIEDQKTRIELSKAFYKAYWVDGINMEEQSELQSVADETLGRAGGVDVSKMAVDCSEILKLNTQEAAGRGAFGVPSFYYKGQVLWGVDRLFLLERMLGRKTAEPERLARPSATPSTAELTYYFDYSSPWSYLGCEQLDRTIQSVYPVKVNINYVPILLGALFKKIGTPVIPLQLFPMAKQQYYSWEMEHYAKEIAQVPMIWPDFFPLRSVLPLRVTIAAGCDPSLIKELYRAVWRDNKDISDPQILSDILTQNGFPSERLLEEANSQPIKDQLFTNTDRAVVKGICGAPTFQVNDGPLIWGQDRLNVVADMLCGWTDGSDVVSKL